MPQYPNPLLPLDRIPLVALPSMNQTHHEEVELVNRLAELVAEGVRGTVDEEAIETQLEAWIGHTRLHFEREAELMRQSGFPAYPVHQGEHDRVLALLDDLQLAWRERRALIPLADFLFAQWPDWFDNHVRTMDSVTASFIQRQGG